MPPSQEVSSFQIQIYASFLVRAWIRLIGPQSQNLSCSEVQMYNKGFPKHWLFRLVAYPCQHFKTWNLIGYWLSPDRSTEHACSTVPLSQTRLPPLWLHLHSPPRSGPLGFLTSFPRRILKTVTISFCRLVPTLAFWGFSTGVITATFPLSRISRSSVSDPLVRWIYGSSPYLRKLKRILWW